MAISAGIAAVSGARQANASQKAANKQADNLTKQAQAEQNALAMQQQQLGAQTAEQMNERTKAARAEAATFDTIAGEYGGGVSIERSAAELAFNRDRDLATMKTNRDMNLSQVGQEAKGADARLNARLASIERPSRIGVGLTIANTAASAYGSYAARQPTTAKVDTSEPGREGRPNRGGK